LVDDDLEFGWHLHWKIGSLLAFEDAIDIAGCLAVLVEPIRPIGD
jgi:hypothetical protein